MSLNLYSLEQADPASALRSMYPCLLLRIHSNTFSALQTSFSLSKCQHQQTQPPKTTRRDISRLIHPLTFTLLATSQTSSRVKRHSSAPSHPSMNSFGNVDRLRHPSRKSRRTDCTSNRHRLPFLPNELMAALTVKVVQDAQISIHPPLPPPIQTLTRKWLRRYRFFRIASRWPA